mmetsp:Transcript_10506/g.16082  ORF Transcript_10506/g.16082 Transcript_10506/m.16082 type:complete len:105 (-) Transcript_10506:2576-2890(-)
MNKASSKSFEYSGQMIHGPSSVGKNGQDLENLDIEREESSDDYYGEYDSYDDEYDDSEDLESFCNNLSKYQIIELRSGDHSMIFDDETANNGRGADLGLSEEDS